VGGALDSAAVPDPLIIRLAAPEDAATIGAIYDEAAASGLATFATGPHPADERRRWLAERGERAPVWCGLLGDEVVAWAALAPFSHREWYAGVGEYTVYVAGGRGGRGLGRRMLDAVIEAAPSYGYWKLVGMILPENEAGLALARRAGFRVVGTHRAHARREGRWRDVTIVERHLTGAEGGGLTDS
jgi:L-amino acid N-acyltransferase YncA